MQLPFALGFAVFSALLTVVPNYGSIVSAIPPILVGLAQSPGKALVVLVVYVIVNQLEGNRFRCFEKVLDEGWHARSLDFATFPEFADAARKEFEVKLNNLNTEIPMDDDHTLRFTITVQRTTPVDGVHRAFDPNEILPDGRWVGLALLGLVTGRGRPIGTRCRPVTSGRSGGSRAGEPRRSARASWPVPAPTCARHPTSPRSSATSGPYS